jgi:4-hydroxy-3-methylbut-2-enyl diphosphate reductase IspH
LCNGRGHSQESNSERAAKVAHRTPDKAATLDNADTILEGWLGPVQTGAGLNIRGSDFRDLVARRAQAEAKVKETTNLSDGARHLAQGGC